MADIFDVLSDPTRRDLLSRLLAAREDEGELSVGALVEHVGLSQPTVSKHLRVLRDQGLVAVREEAQHRFYRVEVGPLEEVVSWLAPFAVVDTVAAPSEPAPTGPVPAIAEQLGRAAANTMHQARTVLDALRQATADARP